MPHKQYSVSLYYLPSIKALWLWSNGPESSLITDCWLWMVVNLFVLSIPNSEAVSQKLSHLKENPQDCFSARFHLPSSLETVSWWGGEILPWPLIVIPLRFLTIGKWIDKSDSMPLLRSWLQIEVEIIFGISPLTWFSILPPSPFISPFCPSLLCSSYVLPLFSSRTSQYKT